MPGPALTAGIIQLLEHPQCLVKILLDELQGDVGIGQPHQLPTRYLGPHLGGPLAGCLSQCNGLVEKLGDALELAAFDHRFGQVRQDIDPFPG